MRIGTSPGASDIMAPGADVDGVKAAADPGNVEPTMENQCPQGDYYVAIQSIDASLLVLSHRGAEIYCNLCFHAWRFQR